MKEKLMDLLAKKNERKAALVSAAEKSESVVELKSINTELDGLNEEIRNLDEMIAGIVDEPVNERTAAVNAPVPGVASASVVEKKSVENTDVSYRVAFANYVTRGIDIPAELRTDYVTDTTDAGYAIAPVIANRIIEKLEATGMILSRVTKTNFAAGVKYPTSSVKPVASWVNEGAGSNTQKKTTGTISFTANKLRCEIAMTQEVTVETLPAFETAFINNVSEAMVKAQEQAIISGDSASGQPKGILTETPVVGQVVEITEGNSITYADLIKAEAALPLAYEGKAVWCMTKKTYMAIEGIVDKNDQPIARVNYGLEGKPSRVILGREVVLNDYMSSISATVSADTPVAFLFDFSDYAFNTNYDMGISRRMNWDNENTEVKAVLACDGKVLDKNSLVVVTVKNS